MDVGLLTAAAGLGLVSGIHCVGMCGGIVTAFATRPVFIEKGNSVMKRQAAFNFGRIASYSLGGALAGTLGASVFSALGAQTALYVAANVALILVGLHLAGATRLLALFERIGAPLWRRVSPLAARLAASPRLSTAFAAGMAWGLLPCGLVYAALATSAFAGGAAGGAAAMAAFGMGTLPWLLAAGVAAARLRAWLHRRPVRVAAGAGLLASGVFGLAHAGGLARGIQNLICL